MTWQSIRVSIFAISLLLHHLNMNPVLRLIFVALISIQFAAALKSKYRPIVIWHGMGDSCCNPQSIGSLKESLEQQLPGVFVHSIDTGSGGSEEDDRKSSFFGNINQQVRLHFASFLGPW